MKPVHPFLLLLLSLLLTACGGGGGSDTTQPEPPTPAPDPEPTGFDYSFAGAAVKGVIAGAGVSVVDAAGNPVGVTTVTNSNGGYDITFNSPTELQAPLLIIVDGSSATVVCDLRPSCDPGSGPDGPLDPVPFGETYLLPSGFELRAAIETLETGEDGETTATAYVSPLSEFVVDAALSLSQDGSLTDGNLDVANDRVVSILEEAFPSLDLPEDVDIASIPLVDVTDLENTDLEVVDEISLVVSSVNAAVLGFVDADDEDRADVSLVVEDLAATISEDVADDTSDPLTGTVEVTLIEEAVKSLEETVEELEELEQAGSIEIPATIVLDELDEISETATASLTDATRIVVNLSTGEMPIPVNSSASGSAELLYLPDTGEAEAIVSLSGTNPTAVQLRAGFAGGPGDVIIEFQQNTQGGWVLPAETVLDQATLSAIASGGTFFQVESSSFPEGEIRGQIVPPGVTLYLLRPTGAEQVPSPVSSTAYSLAGLTINDAAGTAEFHATTSNREIIATSLRRAPAGANGPVLVNTVPDGGDIRHWFSSEIALSDFITELNSGKLYVAVETTAAPAGELRQQILTGGIQVSSFGLAAEQVAAEEIVESSASGQITITFDPSTRSFTAHTNLFGIASPLNVEIGQGLSGDSGATLFGLQPDALFEFVPQSTGVSHWFVSDRTLSDAEFQAYQAGELFVRVSTAAFPAGELRGQLGAFVLLDTDGDGVGDSADAFPEDPEETKDTDEDGVGDNADAFPEDPEETKDSDEDGVGDNADKFPNDPSETQDRDSDGVGDNGDVFPDDPQESQDSDSDGVGDNADACPNDPNGFVDSNNDGTCEVAEDSDGDGVFDANDAFPQDPNETTDSDGDGVGDNADAFPLIATETADSDGDGLGDNADQFPLDAFETTDSDGDGVGDNADAFPQDASETADSDGDGVGDNTDAFPNDPNESVDADNDGIGDNADDCVVTSDPDNPNADEDGIVRNCSEVVTFGIVQEIFDSHCISCHGTEGGLTLTSDVSFSQLVNVPSQDIPTLDRVEPGDADQSYLVWKLEGRDDILGTIQPPSGRLSDSEIDQIKSWINDGANE